MQWDVCINQIIVLGSMKDTPLCFSPVVVVVSVSLKIYQSINKTVICEQVSKKNLFHLFHNFADML